MRRAPLRWRRIKRYRRTEPRTHELWCGDEHFATAQENQQTGRWFWYGMCDGIPTNTCNTPDTLEAVKAEATARAREEIARRARAAGIPVKEV